MSSALVWLVPLTPASMMLGWFVYTRVTGERQRSAKEEKRRRNIAHERAWTLIRGRQTRKRLTYRGDEKA